MEMTPPFFADSLFSAQKILKAFGQKKVPRLDFSECMSRLAPEGENLFWLADKVQTMTRWTQPRAPDPIGPVFEVSLHKVIGFSEQIRPRFDASARVHQSIRHRIQEQLYCTSLVRFHFRWNELVEAVVERAKICHRF